jgi:AcrR family transcriptional regulator
MRTIAQEADVDTALIHHFFLTKEGLFAAAVDGALNPPDLLTRALDGPRGHVGERTVRLFFEFWDDPEINVRLVGLLRSMTALGGAAGMVRGFLANAVLHRLVAALGSANPDLRAALAGSQLVGLATLRYVYQAEPVSSLAPAEVAAYTRRTFQTTLVGTL